MSAMHEALQVMLGAMPPHDDHSVNAIATRKLYTAFQRVSRLAVDLANNADAHRKTDRAALLAMAGNIAAGMCSDPSGLAYMCSELGAEQRQRIAEASVDIARRIMAIVDAPETTKG